MPTNKRDAFRYAETTTVPESKSRADVEDLLEKFGIEEHAVRKTPARVDIAFTYNGLAFQLGIDLPLDQPKERMRRWRVLLLKVKADLVAVEEGIVTFEEAFMAHIVTDNNATLSERIRPAIEAARKSKTPLALGTRQ